MFLRIAYFSYIQVLVVVHLILFEGLLSLVTIRVLPVFLLSELLCLYPLFFFEILQRFLLPQKHYSPPVIR